MHAGLGVGTPNVLVVTGGGMAGKATGSFKAILARAPGPRSQNESVGISPKIILGRGVNVPGPSSKISITDWGTPLNILRTVVAAKGHVHKDPSGGKKRTRLMGIRKRRIR